MTTTQRSSTIESASRWRKLAQRINPTMCIEVGWLAAGFVSKFLIQMGTLYYLTRTLDLSGMGLFYTLIGLLACLVPFVQLGSYDLTIRQIARGEDAQVVAGRAMRSSVVMFFILVPVLLLLRRFFAPEVAWPAYLGVAAGELLVMRVMSNVQAVATGFRLHYVVACSDFLLGLFRFIAIFVAFRLHAGVDVVLGLYAFTAIPAMVAACVWMVNRIGWPKLLGGSVLADLADHVRMVAAWFAEMAAREGDKPLLKAFGGSAQTGIFGTATRLFSVALVPIDLLSQVLRPRVGKAFADGEEAGQALSQKMRYMLVAVGALVGLGLAAVALLVPHVAPQLVKSQFEQVRIALLYLSIVPPIYGLQRANIIIAISRGATGAYATATLVAAPIALGVLIFFAPAFGWRAACLATVIYLSVSCFASWLLMHLRGRPQAALDPIIVEAETEARELELGAAV